MTDLNPQNGDWLLAKSEIVEQPFASNVPLIGPLVAWFRTRWNNVATRWYVQPLIKQQSEYNAQLVERIRDFESYTYELSSEQDRDQSRMQHDVAALGHQVGQLNRRLKALDEHLAGIVYEPPTAPERDEE